MSRAEFERFYALYREQPFDEFSRYGKPTIAMLLARASPKSLDEVLAWLRNETPESTGYSQSDLKMMRALGVRPPRKKRA